MDSWLGLPELLFSDIMMMVIWESPHNRRIMKERIERSWGPEMFPSDEEISLAKMLGEGCMFLKFTNVTFL